MTPEGTQKKEENTWDGAVRAGFLKEEESIR